jgi:hypothetical protein
MFRKKKSKNKGAGLGFGSSSSFGSGSKSSSSSTAMDVDVQQQEEEEEGGPVFSIGNIALKKKKKKKKKEGKSKKSKANMEIFEEDEQGDTAHAQQGQYDLAGLRKQQSFATASQLKRKEAPATTTSTTSSSSAAAAVAADVDPMQARIDQAKALRARKRLDGVGMGEDVFFSKMYKADSRKQGQMDVDEQVRGEDRSGGRGQQHRQRREDIKASEDVVVTEYHGYEDREDNRQAEYQKFSTIEDLAVYLTRTHKSNADTVGDLTVQVERIEHAVSLLDEQEQRLSQDVLDTEAQMTFLEQMSENINDCLDCMESHKPMIDNAYKELLSMRKTFKEAVDALYTDSEDGTVVAGSVQALRAKLEGDVNVFMQDALQIMADVHPTYASVKFASDQLHGLKSKYPHLYDRAYIGASAKAVFTPYVRFDLVTIDLLASPDVDSWPWFGVLSEFGVVNGKEASAGSVDMAVVPALMAQQVGPLLLNFTECVWDCWLDAESGALLALLEQTCLIVNHPQDTDPLVHAALRRVMLCVQREGHDKHFGDALDVLVRVVALCALESAADKPASVQCTQLIMDVLVHPILANAVNADTRGEMMKALNERVQPQEAVKMVACRVMASFL